MFSVSSIPVTSFPWYVILKLCAKQKGVNSKNNKVTIFFMSFILSIYS
jgi:hypothetical protein